VYIIGSLVHLSAYVWFIQARIVGSSRSFPGRLVQSPESNCHEIARAYTNGIVIHLSTIQNDKQLFSGWGDCTNDLDLYRSGSINRPKSANLAGIHNIMRLDKPFTLTKFDLQKEKSVRMPGPDSGMAAPISLISHGATTRTSQMSI
jgi:hypothetical protein